MKPRLNFRLWKFWGCIGWFSGAEFCLLRVETQIFNPELGYLFMFSFQVAKFAIEFGIDFKNDG